MAGKLAANSALAESVPLWKSYEDESRVRCVPRQSRLRRIGREKSWRERLRNAMEVLGHVHSGADCQELPPRPVRAHDGCPMPVAVHALQCIGIMPRVLRRSSTARSYSRGSYGFSDGAGVR